MKRSRSVIAVLGGLVISLSTAQGQRAGNVLGPCAIERVPAPVLCGKVSVPERREDPASRRIELNVMVLQATDGAPLADPITFLAGGGVLPATRLAPFLSRALGESRRTRDILLVDQRGTGNSNALTCALDLTQQAAVADAEPDTALIRQRVERCLGEITTHADPRAYSTTRAMHDLELVRTLLGYGQLNIWGLSYGTKAAREYLRLYPDQVRSLVLSGVVPRARAWWGQIAVRTDQMLGELERLCRADARCGSSFPDLSGSLRTLTARLEQEPARINDSTRVTAADVRRVVQNRMGEGWSAATIPLLVRDALDGDLTPFVPPRLGAPPIPPGVFYGITCSEEFRRFEGEHTRATASGTFLGARGVLQHLAICAAWPTWQIEPGLWEEVASDVPTLVLSGALDHITPSDLAEPVVAKLSRSRHLILPLRSHNDFDPCLGGIIQRFVGNPDPGTVNDACLRDTPPLRFPTTKAELPTGP